MGCIVKSNAARAMKATGRCLWIMLICVLLLAGRPGPRPVDARAEATPPATGEEAAFAAIGAVWHVSVMEADKADEILQNIREPLARFAPLETGMRYLLVQVDAIDYDAAVTDPISLWRALDTQRLVFYLGGEAYANSLAVEYGTQSAFCFVLIVPQATPSSAPLKVTGP